MRLSLFPRSRRRRCVYGPPPDFGTSGFNPRKKSRPRARNGFAHVHVSIFCGKTKRTRTTIVWCKRALGRVVWPRNGFAIATRAAETICLIIADSVITRRPTSSCPSAAINYYTYSSIGTTTSHTYVITRSVCYRSFVWIDVDEFRILYIYTTRFGTGEKKLHEIPAQNRFDDWRFLSYPVLLFMWTFVLGFITLIRDAEYFIIRIYIFIYLYVFTY